LPGTIFYAFLGASAGVSDSSSSGDNLTVIVAVHRAQFLVFSDLALAPLCKKGIKSYRERASGSDRRSYNADRWGGEEMMLHVAMAETDGVQ
jgi:hypothetical protein